MGIHIIAEFLGVSPEKISKVEKLREILDRVVAKSNLHVISSSFHQFEPYGVSAVYLLSESHLSIHTWPETVKKKVIRREFLERKSGN